MLNHLLTYQEHVTHVRLVLLEHGLYAKAQKCEHHKREITFLGYRIHPDGVRMEQSKVSKVTDWAEPDTVKGLQRFLGFANFYRHFIVVPLTNLLKGNKKIYTDLHRRRG